LKSANRLIVTRNASEGLSAGVSLARAVRFHWSISEEFHIYLQLSIGNSGKKPCKLTIAD
jgi:hypothetical protein